MLPQADVCSDWNSGYPIVAAVTTKVSPPRPRLDVIEMIVRRREVFHVSESCQYLTLLAVIRFRHASQYRCLLVDCARGDAVKQIRGSL